MEYRENTEVTKANPPEGRFFGAPDRPIEIEKILLNVMREKALRDSLFGLSERLGRVNLY